MQQNQRYCLFFLYSAHSPSLPKKTDVYPQCNCRQFSERSRCITLVAATVASSLEQRWRGLVSSLPCNSTPPDFYLFILFFFPTCSLQTQTMLTQVTSLGAIHRTSHSSLWRLKRLYTVCFHIRYSNSPAPGNTLYHEWGSLLVYDLAELWMLSQRSYLCPIAPQVLQSWLKLQVINWFK